MGYCSDVYLEVKKEHKERLIEFFEEKTEIGMPKIIEGENTVLAVWTFVKWYDSDYENYNIYEMMSAAGIPESDFSFERFGEDCDDYDSEGGMNRSFQHIESVVFAGKRLTRHGLEIIEEELPEGY